MGDKRRFNVFADLITEKFPSYQDARIADVAGGKGYLQMALRQRGYTNIMSFDKRKKYSNRSTKRLGMYRWGWFDCRKHSREFDLVVGMHPDGGTDHIIEYGRINNTPFAVCPCCAIPSAAQYWGSHSNYREWMEHLEKLARNAAETMEVIHLPINGRSIVIIGDSHVRV